MSSSGKTVKFRRESPSGGSYLDHQRSDSGVGSFSDSDSRDHYGDRYAGSDYESPPPAYVLQEALDAELAAKKEWMKKAQELNEIIIQSNKDLKETEARMRALDDHVQQLTDDKAKLQKLNKELTDENNRLRDDLAKDKDTKDKDKRASRHKGDSPPLMSGANGSAAEKPKRSGSKHRSSRETGRADREKERERIAKDLAKEMERETLREAQRETQRETQRESQREQREMDRLRKRFDARERGEESDATGKSGNSTKSHRSRRDSYIEPIGQAAPRPQVHSHGPVPPSPSTRGGSYYGTAAYPQQPQYAPAVPGARPGHPSVVVSYANESYDDEDGTYHPHPLPKQPRSHDRRR